MIVYSLAYINSNMGFVVLMDGWRYLEYRGECLIFLIFSDALSRPFLV